MLQEKNLLIFNIWNAYIGVLCEYFLLNFSFSLSPSLSCSLSLLLRLFSLYLHWASFFVIFSLYGARHGNQAIILLGKDSTTELLPSYIYQIS
jgi:hypothetical protein